MKNMVRYIANGDLKLLNILNGNIKCRLLDIIMPYITKLGGVIFSVLFPLLLIIVGKENMRLIGIQSYISLTLSQMVVQLLKKIVSRIRPYDIFKHINTFNIYLKDYSFPSGHTAASFSMGLIIALNLSSFMLPVMILAGMVGISRVYLGVHYPSDVFAGAILGSVSSLVTHSMFF